jgi:hypothetical protein
MGRTNRIVAAGAAGALLALAAVAGADALGLRLPFGRGTSPDAATQVAAGAAGAPGGSALARAGGIASPTGFVPVTPCRIADTRKAAAGKMAAESTRTLQVYGSSGFGAQGGNASGCAIPAEATAVAVSLTALSSEGDGYVRAWAANGPEPTATMLNFTALGGSAGITAGAPIPLSPQGTVKVRVHNVATHLVVDVTGYYTEAMSGFVSADGTLQLRTGQVIYAGRLGTGYYVVQTLHSISGCTVSATSTSWATRFITAYAYGDKAYFSVTDHSGTGLPAADTDFTFTITC